MMRPRSTFYGKSQDSLCCCEYIDKTGNTNHILACCCNCEALDETFDSLITCKKLNNKSMVEMLSTIEDRLRFPGFYGKGAVKVKFDVAVPVLLVPCGILLGAVHPAMTVIMLLAMPLALILCYRLWVNMKVKPRTQIFFVFGIVSYVQMFMTFQLVVCRMLGVELTKNIICSSLFLLLIYLLFVIRTNTGIIRSRGASAKSQARRQMFKQFLNNQESDALDTCCNGTEKSHSPTNSKDESHNLESNADSTNITENVLKKCVEDGDDDLLQFGAIGAVLVKNFGMDRSMLAQNVEAEKRRQEMMAYLTPSAYVSWVDSRITSEGNIFTWCEPCGLEKPPRAGHCNLCQACVHCRDHHCVWVDACIGGHNHRAFILAIVVFIIGGLYGAHISMATICAPAVLKGSSLFYSSSCPSVYGDFYTALVFVSAMYSLIAVLGMVVILTQQAVVISHNVTSEELHKAHIRGWTRGCGLIPRHHVLDRGCLKNWWHFVRGDRLNVESYEAASETARNDCDCGC